MCKCNLNGDTRKEEVSRKIEQKKENAKCVLLSKFEIKHVFLARICICDLDLGNHDARYELPRSCIDALSKKC